MIKGKTQTILEDGRRVSYTFSNEDFSLSWEAKYTKQELRKAFEGKEGFAGAMLPCEIEELKLSKKFFQALEDAAELLPEALNLIKSNTPFAVRTEMYENGNIKMYIDGKLVSETKSDKDSAKFALSCIREHHFYD